MVLSFSSVGTALADSTKPNTEKATITITNAVKGTTYYAYKLFDATVGTTTTKADDNTESTIITSIAYKQTDKYGLPDTLKTYFVADAQGNITPTTDAISSGGLSTEYTGGNTPEASKALVDVLTTWAYSSNIANSPDYTVTATTDSDVSFNDLPYGYYVITSSTGSADAAQVTVTSSYPDREVTIKDLTTPATDFAKTVSSENVSVGDEITYTITFTATNYYETDNGLEEIENYTITDLLPTSLNTANTAASVTVVYEPSRPSSEETTATEEATNDEEATNNEEAADAEEAISTEEIDIPTPTVTPIAYEETGSTTTTQRDCLTIVIPWSKEMKSPGTVTVTYTAKVNEKVITNSAEQNKNKASIAWRTKNNTNLIYNGDEAEVQIKTSAIAIQKVDESGAPLKGATFSVKGLVVEENNTETGVYTVASYDDNSETYSKALSCNDEGVLVILGIEPSGSTTSADGTTISSINMLTVQEEQAPNGYNKMVGTKEIEVTELKNVDEATTSDDDASSTIQAFKDLTTYAGSLNIKITSSTIDNETVYSSEETNYGVHVLTVKNSKGTILPSTGGMGTTILYVIGGLLIVCAGGALYIRRRNQA
jgi:LPXTG-motif cell wall-anchored protein/uncharacterized repeat protein (TIGR01451 family)